METRHHFCNIKHVVNKQKHFSYSQIGRLIDHQYYPKRSTGFNINYQNSNENKLERKLTLCALQTHYSYSKQNCDVFISKQTLRPIDSNRESRVNLQIHGQVVLTKISRLSNAEKSVSYKNYIWETEYPDVNELS